MKNKENFEFHCYCLPVVQMRVSISQKDLNFLFGGRIIGTDINQRWSIPTIQCLDEFYQVPLSSDKIIIRLF